MGGSVISVAAAEMLSYYSRLYVYIPGVQYNNEQPDLLQLVQPTPAHFTLMQIKKRSRHGI